MVDITYDSSGQLNWIDPKTGETFIYNGADIAWTLASTVLVWIMSPGVGFLYSGLLRRKNGLSMIYLSLGTIAVVTFQWFFWGFSLAFSDTGTSRFIGDLSYFGLKGVLAKPSIPGRAVRVPAIVFCIFQMMFATITPMIAVGAIAERGRLGPVLLFIFIWSTLVYDPVACWTWNSNGWSHDLGVLDFAGGTTVHITSGTAALAISIFLGRRNGYGTEELHYRPHNTSYVVLGTVFMWFGWFGFNGGSAYSANLRAAQACLVTTLAASVGGATWMFWDYLPQKKWSVVGFCSGAVSSLVAITPASGYVGAPAAVAFGVAAGTVCNWATYIRIYFEWDDTLDIFASHAIGGLVGNILTGLFAQKSIAALDGRTVIAGGWLDHHWIQLAYQLANSAAGMSYSFVMTTLILHGMRLVPALDLRCRPEFEAIGIDETEIGEFAYDYVAVDKEIVPRPMYVNQDVAPAPVGREAVHRRRNVANVPGGLVSPGTQEYEMENVPS